MNEPQHPPIFRRSVADEVPERRFEGDLFEREELAKRLTGFLSRLPDGAVMAIDSPWGEGKTWFGKRWQASLKDEGCRTAYIDCFQRDHLDDPFLMIASEFIELAKAGKPEVRTRLLEAGKKLGVSLIPSATKFAVNAIGHWAIGKADLADDMGKALEALDASAASGLEKVVSKRLEEFEADKKTIDAFKMELANLAAEEDKPIVVFLDELDRCRPDFAVKTIERVKHFFDVPKVVFVLMLNRRQLAAAIEGLYGPKVDAEAYLGKFIQLSLTLPKRLSVEMHGQDDNRKQCAATLARYGFKSTNENGGFANAMGVLATHFSMSLRDVERAVALFSFAQPVSSSASFIAWPIALKLKKPDLFARLLANDRAAHIEASKLAEAFAVAAPNFEFLAKLFVELHQSGSHDFQTALSAEQAQMLSAMARIGGPKAFFSWLFERVDLSVSA